ncbi:MAG: nuclear transport factor 2 family protein [Woeseia sp.]
MTFRQVLSITLLGTILFAFGTVPAQEAAEEPAADEAVVPEETDDYVAVWSVIEEQWEAAQRGDRRWVERLLSADFIGWPKNSPAPRDKASTRMWNDFSTEQSKGLAHELYPLSTVIHGDMAIAHYMYTNASENSEGETEVTNGRYTDVLVRDGGEWKFIAWHGGDDDPDD